MSTQYKPQPVKPLSLMEARAHFGEMVQRAYYGGEQFRVTRNNRPMARLVSEHVMQAIEELIATDPSLEETLSIMLDPELMAAIEKSRKEYAEGKKIPISQVLE